MGSRNVQARLLHWKISYDQRVAELSSAEAMLLYTWLIPCQDNKGRLEGSAEVIKGMVFPRFKRATIQRIEQWLSELDQIGLICRYTIDREQFIQFPDTSVRKYQRILGNMGDDSDFPPPNQEIYKLWSDNLRSRMNHHKLVNTSLPLREVKVSKEKISKDKMPTDGGLWERFESFWKAYPRKIGKGRASRTWLKLHPTQELTDRMLKAIAHARDSAQWQKENGQFIPHPTTWLNDERWTDEYSSSEYGKSERVRDLERSVLNE